MWELFFWNPPASIEVKIIDFNKNIFIHHQVLLRWVWWKFHLYSVLRLYTTSKTRLHDFMPRRYLIKIKSSSVLFWPSISLNRRIWSSLGLSWGFEKPDQRSQCWTGLSIAENSGAEGIEAWNLSPILTFDWMLVFDMWMRDSGRKSVKSVINCLGTLFFLTFYSFDVFIFEVPFFNFGFYLISFEWLPPFASLGNS